MGGDGKGYLLRSPRSLLWNSSTKGSDIGANLQSMPNESATFPYLPENKYVLHVAADFLLKKHCLKLSKPNPTIYVTNRPVEQKWRKFD